MKNSFSILMAIYLEFRSSTSSLSMSDLLAEGQISPLAPIKGALYNVSMRIISRKALREFWEKHPDVRQSLQAWYADVKRAEWKTPSDIKDVYRSGSIAGNNRAVFNIEGNRYRIVIAIQYEFGIVYIRFVGTHTEYDKIAVTKI